MSEPPLGPENLMDFLINKGNGVKGLSQLNLKKVPDEFIQPPKKDLEICKLEECIPLIDVSNPDDPKLHNVPVRRNQVGFFQMINHGIPVDILDDMKKCAHFFFELPWRREGNISKRILQLHSGLEEQF